VIPIRSKPSVTNARSAAEDRSNGWEAVADTLIAGRSNIGAATARTWARSLPKNASVLDLGCGSGVPVSEALMEEGCIVSGIDASPTLAVAFATRFPHAQVACEPAEESRFFGRRFDGIIAIGLIFLLRENAQRALIGRDSAALHPGGRFVFTAPVEIGTWADITTGRESVSLGEDVYRAILAGAGLSVVAEYVDERRNHYYDTVKNRP
jgi:cyclopropane fatty-acyl-phospholipid synthase-like methyltransferase